MQTNVQRVAKRTIIFGQSRENTAYALMKSKITMPAYHCHYITDTNAGQTISNIGKLFQIFILPPYAMIRYTSSFGLQPCTNNVASALLTVICFNKQTSHVSFLLFNTVFRLIYFGFVYFTTVGLLAYRYLGCLVPYPFHSTKSCRRYERSCRRFG